MVTDEDLYQLIQELDPYYSITDLAQRYSVWSVKDISYINVEPGYYKYVDQDYHDNLEAIEYLKFQDQDPMDPAVVRFDGTKYYYFHMDPSLKLRKYDPFNLEALNYLRDGVGSFSLQKEYDRIQALYNIKHKPHRLDPILDLSLHTLIFDPTDETLWVGYGGTFNVPNVTIVADNGYKTAIKATMEDFLTLVAKDWDGINDCIIKEHLTYITKHSTNFTTSIY